MKLWTIKDDRRGRRRTDLDQFAMPQHICVDLVFGRNTPNTLMYRLACDKVYQWKHESDLIVRITDEHPPRRLGGDRWTDDQGVGNINRGQLYHAVMTYYPQPHREVPDPVDVAVKWVRGKRAIASLHREAEMYDGPLYSLQGQVVPIFAGIFTATTRDGFDIGCLILEWCPGNDHTTFGKPTEDELRVREAAVRQLHEAGVHHGQLFERDEALCLSDGRHFLRAADGTLRIVDFQRAFTHRCVNKDTDLDSISEADDDSVDGEEICDELFRVITHYQRALEGELRTTPWNAF